MGRKTANIFASSAGAVGASKYLWTKKYFVEKKKGANKFCFFCFSLSAGARSIIAQCPPTTMPRCVVRWPKSILPFWTRFA